MTSDKILPTEQNRQTSTLPTADDLVGRVLYERFLIERDVSDPASGRNCSSYLAKDLTYFCRKVVIRALTQPPTEHPVPSNSFQDICGALMQLDHPNIESIVETGRLFDGRPYAVTGYTSGQSLSQMLNGDRRVVLDRAAQIVESIAEALGAAHSRKILHCDVTPANIVITPQEREAQGVRLVSFGTAWPFGDGSDRLSNIDLQSLFYTAPELMVEDARATVASDVYSLAAVAYRMLTGEVPFKATEREEMLELIARGVPVRPSNLRTDLPTDAEAILISALQYKAAMRPRDIAVFGQALANALRDGGYHPKISRYLDAEVPALLFQEENSVAEIDTQAREPLVEPKRRVVQKAAAIVSDRALVLSLIVSLLAGALFIPIFQTILNEGQKPAAVSSIVNKAADTRLPREIKYSIDGQNIKNPNSADKWPTSSLQNSFVSSGEYRITFESDSAGNAYIFSEVADEQGKTTYKVLYPLSKVNSGSAHIEPGQPAKTLAGNFNDAGSSEIVWLVWTAGKQNDLESARLSAIEADGVLHSDGDVQKLRHFLERNKNNKLDVRTDDTDKLTVLNGSGDRIVHRIEIKHN